MKVNPNTNQGQIFTIVDNTADTLFINSTEGNLNSVAVAGDAFSGVFSLNTLKVLGQAGGQCSEEINIS